MEGATVIDGIKYIGDSRFIITNSKLMELLEKSIAYEVCDWVNGDNWDGWKLTSDALDDMYPGKGETPYDVADSLAGQITEVEV